MHERLAVYLWLANCYFAHDAPPCWHSAMRHTAQLLNVNHFRQRCMKARPDTNYFPVLFKSPLFYLLEVVRPGGFELPAFWFVAR